MNERLEARVGEGLRRLGWKLVLAESCTGGLISHRITDISGSSDYFLGGQVNYDNAAKINWLGVPEELIANHGAVSEPVTLEMARRVRRTLPSVTPVERMVSVAVSGIAGPTGGSAEKPVGMTCIAVSGPRGDRSNTFIFLGNREENKAQAANKALDMLMEYLRSAMSYIPTEVMYQTDSDGLRWAEQFSLGGRMQTVENNGRRWADDSGEHLLVQADGGKVFELFFDSRENRWWVKLPDGDVRQA